LHFGDAQKRDFVFMDVSKHMSPDAHACVSTHFVCVAMPSIKAIEMADVWCVDAQSCDVEARGFCEGNCILSLSNSEIALKKKSARWD